MQVTLQSLPNLFAITTALSTGFALFAQSKPQSSSTALAHTRATFTITVCAPYEEVFALFGPEGERAWAGEEWDPQFLHPSDRGGTARDIPGAVFTIKHGDQTSVWVNTAFDRSRGAIQYVHFIAGLMVTAIELRLKENPSGVRVEVTYERTALNPAANEHVLSFGKHDESGGPRWQEGIDRYLLSRKR